MKKNIDFTKILVIISFVLILFNDIFKNVLTEYFKYSDDLFCLVIIILGIVKLIKNKFNIKKSEKYIFILYILLFLVGLMGNIISHYQTSYIAIVLDMFAVCKFYLIYTMCVNILDKKTSRNLLATITKICKVFVVVGCLFEIYNIIFGISSGVAYSRFGINAFTLSGHPYYACALFACASAVFLNNIKGNRVWFYLSLLLTALTFRFKAFGYIFFTFLAIIMKGKKVKPLNITIIVLALVLIFSNQIRIHFFNVEYARGIAFVTSLKIFKDFFPIGSGFATFGSMMSGIYYSYSYIMYGLSDRFGFSPNAYNYIGDGGIATILGQFGLVGIVIFTLLTYFLIKNVKERSKNNLSAMCIIVYMLISSTNEISFSSDYAPLLAFVLSVLVISNNYKTFELSDKAKEYKNKLLKKQTQK